MAKKTRRPARKKPDETSVGGSSSGPTRDEVGALIRREIVWLKGIERSREPLALIAETAIRFPEDGSTPGYVIVDASGAPRTRKLRGKIVPVAIADLVRELRRDHPNLFQDKPLDPVDLGPEADRGEATGLSCSPLLSATRLAAPEPDHAESASSAPEPATIGPAATTEPDGAARPIAASEAARPAAAGMSRDWIALGEAPNPQPTQANAAASAPIFPAAAPLDVPADRPALEPSSAPEPPPASDSVQPVAASRPAARRYREPVAIRPVPASTVPSLAGGWRPSPTLMRVFYVAAFLCGMAVFSAVRHLS